jgi:microcin C transport system substrate-binding protein
MVPPMGSGPYVVDSVNPGKSITYKRNPYYWAINHPTRKGMFNFDTITFKYFRDQIVAVEAFKANEFDFMYINIAKQWARDLVGPKFESRQIMKEYLPHRNNQGMQGFVFNLRKPLFQDRRVREALGMAFDFEWANNKLFFNEYTRSASYFSNSDVAAKGLPAGLEREYLQPFKDQLPPEVFTQPLTPFSTEAPNSLRENLRNAKKILEEAGWTVQDGRLTNKEGKTFDFEILLVSPSFERVMAGYVNNLSKLGVNASYRTIDPALYIDRLNRFDFEMTVNVFGQSQSPGNEQRDYWHSSSADRNGSRNLIGIKDPVVDQLVEKIIYAETQEELTAACKALDRVLWYGYYVVPNWYVARHRVSYWNKFNHPETLPLYYNPTQALMTWWMKSF